MPTCAIPATRRAGVQGATGNPVGLVNYKVKVPHDNCVGSLSLDFDNQIENDLPPKI